MATPHQSCGSFSLLFPFFKMRRPSESSPRRRVSTSMHSPAPPSSAFPHTGGLGEGTVIAEIGDDILEKILSKLPAQSFASAACVSRSWNSVCSRILSRSKLSSALSLNPSLPEAVDEVVKKVLSEPIRPHFAILYVNDKFCLEDAHRFVAMKLGSSTPMITSEGAGIIGRDALTGEFKEVMGMPLHADEAFEQLLNRGVLLTVGYLPGLKVQVVHLRRSEEEQLSIERFVRDVRDCSSSISGSPSPAAIIMFGEVSCNMKPVLHSLCNALSQETIVVGNEAAHFTWTGEQLPHVEAVAFIFAKDRYKSDGPGKIQFHLAFSSGIAYMGPTFKAVSVKTRSDENTTWLTAKREGFNEILDGGQILEVVADVGSDLYIGVTKKRKCAVIGSEKVKSVISMEYHQTLGGDEEYLYVHGLDIKTGDLFQFYAPDPEVALASAVRVSKDLKKLKEDVNITGMQRRALKEVFGGLIFSCCGRGEPFFGESNVDSSPILENFPRIPLAGVFCGGEIARGPFLASTSGEGGSKEGSCSARCSLHVYSSVYLLLSFDPRPL